MLCLIENCNRPSFGRGWCKRHYEQNRVYGNPVSVRQQTLDFVEATIGSATDECIVWPWGLSARGYGRVHIGEMRMLAHRYVCERVHGAPPRGKEEAAHNCGTPACVNPKHLRWASHAENMADKIIHGTLTRGSNISWSKLNEDAVRDILVCRTSAINMLAKRYNVDPEVIRKIWAGQTWKWMNDELD